MAQRTRQPRARNRGLGAAIVLGALLLAMSVMAAQADAKIVVGRGAAGVRLGDSKHHVIRTLGKPIRSSRTSLVYAKPCLCTIVLKHHRVRSIDVLSKSQRTNRGVGPGTSYAKTTTAYPGAKCHHPPIYGETSQLCVLKSKYKGRTVKTIFAFFEQDLGVRDVEIRFG